MRKDVKDQPKRYRPRDPNGPLIWADILELAGWALAILLGGAVALYHWLSY